MLKKKYPQHVFHKQDVYNTIYKLCQSNNHEKSSDSTSLLDTLFEKVSQDPTWKVFVRYSANALIEDELSSTYVWILKCLMKATDNIISKSIWTDFEPGLINAISQNELGKAYTSFQFNASIQSTQSVESFNGIIKKSLNAASTLYDVQAAIDKRHKEKLTPEDLNLQSNTLNDNFIEDVIDEPQTTLKSL
uniref:MULE transposase domain-containing protein n=1 Tax=Rhizophagus irregularis (strain DAOM 181602 / DAOM 197198 / MUCL 43194) TaxID=747089 RepID=U9UVW6_RHIID